MAVKLAEKNMVAIPPMDRSEAVRLLEANLVPGYTAGTSDIETTTKLVELLTHLPLAIRQASAYMNENHISMAEYLEIYKSDEDEMVYLLSQEFEDNSRYDDIRNPIATTWWISFRQILRQSPLAADYLRFMCFLAQQDIPQALLPLDKKAKMAEAIGMLKGYAFITEREQSNSYDIHRLVQLSARNWLKQSGEWNVWVTKVLRQLTNEFPFPQHQNKYVWIRYLPHTDYILVLYKPHHDELESELLSKIGRGLYILGKYPELEQLYRRILELKEKVLDKEHPDILESMAILANALGEQRKYEEAEQIHQKTLELREKVLGKEHPNTLGSMNDLAVVFNEQGRYKEAEQMHRRTLELEEKVLGKEDPDTLSSMNNLATVLDYQGKYKEAELLYRKTLELKEKVLGKEHPITLGSMNNLANAIANQGKYKEAEQIYRQTLELEEKVLGKEHPVTLCSMNNLTITLNRQGKYEEAALLYRKTLELREKVLDKDHPDIQRSRDQLARCLKDKAESMRSRSP